MGCQLGQLQFLVTLLSWKGWHRCRCLVKGILARMHAWQLRYTPQSHSCSKVSCARGWTWRSSKSYWGLQLWSAHPGYSSGQPAGHLYDLGGLASSPGGGSYSKSGHLLDFKMEPCGNNSLNWLIHPNMDSSCGNATTYCSAGHPVQTSQTQGIWGDPLSVGFASHTERGCSKGMPWWGGPCRPGVHAWPHMWQVLLALHGCSGKGNMSENAAHALPLKLNSPKLPWKTSWPQIL